MHKKLPKYLLLSASIILVPAAYAQEDDLAGVEMDVMEVDQTPDEAVSNLSLPPQASDRAVERSSRGLQTANSAKEDGAAFGQATAAAARENGSSNRDGAADRGRDNAAAASEAAADNRDAAADRGRDNAAAASESAADNRDAAADRGRETARDVQEDRRPETAGRP